MWKNLINVAFRNLWNEKYFSSINMLGLSIGIASCLIIVLTILSELQYDRHFKDVESIYRVGTAGRLGDEEFDAALTPPPLAEALALEFPEVEKSARLLPLKSPLVVKVGDNLFSERHALFADSTIFSLFDFPFAAGSSEYALSQPNAIVLTKATAHKYFGDQDAMNQTLEIDTTVYKITGVLEELSGNSHVQFDFLISMSSNPMGEVDHWGVHDFYTYIKLRSGATGSALEAKLGKLVETQVSKMLVENLGFSYDKLKEQGGYWKYRVMPVRNIHLYSTLEGEMSPGGSVNDLYALAIIAFIILMVACVNFVNLSTAKYASRAKEVGVRKVLGSVRSLLIYQFLSESVLISLLSGAIALVIAWLILPVYNDVVGKQLEFLLVQDVAMLFLFVLAVVLIGIIAGCYPAFYLTAFSPAQVLKGTIRSGLKSGTLRSVLVSTQFGISVVLIVCTLIVYQQLQFSLYKQPGFNKENVIVISNGFKLAGSEDAFKNAVLAYPEISSVCVAQGLPSREINSSAFKIVGSDKDNLLRYFYADYDFLTTLGITVLAGRNFSRDIPSDEEAVMINESAMKELGLNAQDALGTRLVFADRKEYKVVGVVRDFNIDSFKFKIKPLVIMLFPEGQYVAVRIRPGNESETLAKVGKVWASLVPDAPFEYSFLDKDFDALLKHEERMGKLFTIFTVLSLFVSCIGLVGLVSFVAEQRLKEVSIRKVLGARRRQVVILLIAGFVKPVIYGSVAALPIAYFAMQWWIQDYAFRISIGVLPFVMAMISVLVVAILTVAFQAIRSASQSPLRSLRAE